MTYDLFISNAEVYTDGVLTKTNLGIKQGVVAYIGHGSGNVDGAENDTIDAKEILDLKGHWVLPGLIDSQVHFREPGLTHKEDLHTGTKAAVLGGITAVLEMPNTKPSTSTQEAFEEKMSLAKDRCFVDYGFFIGATHENVEHLKDLQNLPGCCGIKIFMGSSTGSLLLDDDVDLENVFAKTSAPMSVHCEDEKRLIERKHLAESSKSVFSHPEWRDTDTGFIATEKVVRLSKKYNRPVNVLHISSKKEIEFLAKEKDKNITVECLPQFLTLFGPDCYEKMGTRAQMNPPVRFKDDYEALIKALKDGVIDVIGSDHAPHTLEEKAKQYPQSPSGMPGVQTIVNLMLDKVLNGVITLDRMLSLLCFKPLEIFKIKNRGQIAMGLPATFTIVDPKATTTLDDKYMATKCGWTPYHGMSFKGKVTATVLSGHLVMKDGQIIGQPQGQPLQYQRP